jgi:hypothetical protein
MSTPRFAKVATSVLALGLGSLGVIAVVSRDFLAPLQPIGDLGTAGPLLGALHGLVLAALAAGLTINQWKLRSTQALAALLMSWAILAQVPRLIETPNSIATRVAAMETLVLAIVVWAVGETAMRTDMSAPQFGRWVAASARWALAGMLLLFGWVHLAHRGVIAAMIPAWIPGQALWPWITGCACIAAAAALASGFLARLAALCVGAMFCAWLPLVHLERLARTPDSISEWVFAAMALALAGAALTVAEMSPKSGVRPFGTKA